MSAPESVTLCLAGDVMTGRGIDQILARPSDPELREPWVASATEYVELAVRAHGPVEAPVEPSYVWGEALSILAREKPDAWIANLETSVTTSDAFWPGKGIHYRMHPGNVACLEAASLDACSLANNHVLDFGRAGLVETLEVLAGAGILTAGAGRDRAEAERPARLPLAGGIALSLVACGTTSSGIPTDWAAGPERPGVHLLDDLTPATARRIATGMRRDTGPRELTAVSIHWGANWGYDVSQEEEVFAHALVDAGVDLVHGHSSHHVRPVERYAGRLILYGCGDLITDYEGIHGHEEWRGDLGGLYLATLSRADGALLDLRIVPTSMRRMRLARPPAGDVAWLRDVMHRISRPFGAAFELRDDGSLGLAATDVP